MALYLIVTKEKEEKIVNKLHFIWIVFLIINAFLPIPGASGCSEACYMLFFGFLGTVGVSSSMALWRFVSYYIGLILGALVFSFDKEIKSCSNSSMFLLYPHMANISGDILKLLSQTILYLSILLSLTFIFKS